MGCRKIIFLTAFLVAMGASALVDTMASARVRAKARLREALAQDDKVSNPDVIAAVDALSIYNPTDAPAYDLDAFLGTWASPAALKDEEALVNVAAAMGFNYAYEGFPTC